MSVVCPNCGTQVDEESRVCPACHYEFTEDQATASADVRWCESCGSPIPSDRDACPECGLPVEGAFEDKGERYSVTKPRNDEIVLRGDDAEGLVSAVPPTPQSGESEVGNESHATKKRLLIASAIAALLLVGGTTLFITRPWDPNAYSTHATVEADTSMEGYPGEKNLLVSQDHVEEGRQRSTKEKLQQALTNDRDSLSNISNKLKSCHDEFLGYLQRGALQEGSTLGEDIEATRSQIKQIRTELEELKVDDSDLEDQRHKMLVLVEYLESAADVLGASWTASQRNDGSLDAMLEARSILEGSGNNRGYDEWYELFTNAFAG